MPVKYEPSVLREQLEALVKFRMENFPTLEQHLAMGIDDPAQLRHYTFEEAEAAALSLIERSFLEPDHLGSQLRNDIFRPPTGVSVRCKIKIACRFAVWSNLTDQSTQKRLHGICLSCDERSAM
jgi:hypothetical protein